VLVSMALKPTSSIRLPGQTVNVQGEASEVKTTGRHDPFADLLQSAPFLVGNHQQCTHNLRHDSRHRW